MKKTAFIFILLASMAAGARAQELTISFNETFMDALLDGIFTNTAPPEFPLASVTEPSDETLAFGPNFIESLSALDCRQSIRLQRETNGVRTAVRFRDGMILAPLAFNGNYAPPFVGCLGFSGYAETRIDLRYDAASRKLMAYANVTNVNVNGTGGIGGSMVAKLVQSYVDRKINHM